jgi:hypothetical protein
MKVIPLLISFNLYTDKKKQLIIKHYEDRRKN